MSSPHEPIQRAAGTPSAEESRGSGEAAKENASQVADEARQRAGDVTATAKANAGEVADNAKEGAAQVAETAKDEARAVAGEAGRHVQSLVAQVRDDVTTQVGGRQQELAAVLGSLGSGLGRARFGDEPADGLAADLAQQAATRLQGVGSWLGNRGPNEVLDEVKRFARRRPGTFLAAAALTGLVAGRLTRGIADDARDDTPDRRVADDRHVQGTRAPASPVVPAYGSPHESGYDASQPAYGQTTQAQPAYIGDDATTSIQPPVTDTEGPRR